MSNERTTGVTIGELKQFLNTLPAEFDSFGMVNGEVAEIAGQYYARIDKPIVHLEIDEESGEFLLLHQSEDEINDILKNVNGNTEGAE